MASGGRHIDRHIGYHSGRGNHGIGACWHGNRLRCHGNWGVLHHVTKLRSWDTWPTWSSLVPCSCVMRNPQFSILLRQASCALRAWGHCGWGSLRLIVYHQRRLPGWCLRHYDWIELRKIIRTENGVRCAIEMRSSLHRFVRHFGISHDLSLK